MKKFLSLAVSFILWAIGTCIGLLIAINITKISWSWFVIITLAIIAAVGNTLGATIKKEDTFFEKLTIFLPILGSLFIVYCIFGTIINDKSYITWIFGVPVIYTVAYVFSRICNSMKLKRIKKNEEKLIKIREELKRPHDYESDIKNETNIFHRPINRY